MDKGPVVKFDLIGDATALPDAFFDALAMLLLSIDQQAAPQPQPEHKPALNSVSPQPLRTPV